jgi:WD40 repeat protein
LVSGSGDRTIKLWDVATGQELLTLQGHQERVTTVRFSPDGARLVSGDSAGMVKIWETARGRKTFTLKELANEVRSVGFSPDGRRLVCADKEGKASSWDTRTGQPIVPCTDPPPLSGLTAVSPDGALRVTMTGKTISVVRTDDSAPSSDLVFLSQLNDPIRRLRWHRNEADAAERGSEWFAAAFHLRQLIAAGVPDAEPLKERQKRCVDRLRQP